MKCPCAAREGNRWRPCKGDAVVFRADIGQFVCGSHSRKWQAANLWEKVKGMQDALDEFEAGEDWRSEEWKRGEQEACDELAAGMGKTFDDAKDAITWLEEQDD